MEWYFPQKMDELPALLRDGALPHGGGTFLLRGDFSERALTGLISLSKLPLGDVRTNGEFLEIGATCTFSSAVAKMSGMGKKCLLSKALSSAAATPIRNRATIGGSVAALPPWSDLIAPLSVLDAKISIFGKHAGEYDFEKFLSDTKKILEGSIIEKILIPQKNLECKNYYYRETRVAFDYPAFTVAISAHPEDIKIAVSGTTERVTMLSEPGSRLKFARKPAGSPEYLEHAARVQIERGLKEIGGEGA